MYELQFQNHSAEQSTLYSINSVLWELLIDMWLQLTSITLMVTEFAYALVGLPFLSYYHYENLITNNKCILIITLLLGQIQKSVLYAKFCS